MLIGLGYWVSGSLPGKRCLSARCGRKTTVRSGTTQLTGERHGDIMLICFTALTWRQTLRSPKPAPGMRSVDVFEMRPLSYRFVDPDRLAASLE
jgi:hypothetical protein